MKNGFIIGAVSAVLAGVSYTVWESDIPRHYYDYDVPLLLIGVLVGGAVFFLLLENARLDKQYRQLSMRYSERKFLFDAIMEGILVFRQGFCIDANLRAVELLGSGTKTALLGREFQELVTGSCTDAARDYIESTGRCIESFECELLRYDGTTLPVLAKTIVYKNGSAQGMVFIDIKPLKEVERRLRRLTLDQEQRLAREIEKNRDKERKLLQQSRLAQMGEMISMIAHQWRQPLSAIGSTAMGLENKLRMGKFDFGSDAGVAKAEAYFLERTELIARYVETMTETIDDFRNFYREDKQKETVEISQVIERALGIIHALLEQKSIEILVACRSKQSIALFPNEVVQVLLNLLQNAFEQFLEQAVENPFITVEAYDRNDAVIVEVTDNAGGIPEVLLPKIFDPYVSTKEARCGSGLGLYMSKMIIEEHHGGTLRVENRDAGATFVLDLPHDDKEDEE